MKNSWLAAILGALLTCLNPSALSGAEQTLEELRQKLASPVYETRVSGLTELIRSTKEKPLGKEEVDLLLPLLKKDEWRIKVRIVLALPFAANPDWVLQPLISTLQDRDEDSSGGGNVPTGACKALVRLGDPRGLKPCEDWLSYLQSHPKVFGDLHASHLESAKKAISELKLKLKK